MVWWNGDSFNFSVSAANLEHCSLTYSLNPKFWRFFLWISFSYRTFTFNTFSHSTTIYNWTSQTVFFVLHRKFHTFTPISIRIDKNTLVMTKIWMKVLPHFFSESSETHFNKFEPTLFSSVYMTVFLCCATN